MYVTLAAAAVPKPVGTGSGGGITSLGDAVSPTLTGEREEVWFRAQAEQTGNGRRDGG